MKGNWVELKKNVIDRELCCLCGTCIGVCPVNTLDYAGGTIADVRQGCVGCGRCVAACPGKDFSFPEFNQRLFSKAIGEINPDFGAWQWIIKGRAVDKEISGHASSGGIATELGRFLLESGEIDAVIGVTGNKGQADVAVLRTPAQTLEAMQSKYVFVPLNKVIKHIRENEGRYLYIGLPCQIQGLRKAMEVDRALQSRIVLCAGIFCGFNMTADATDFLIRKSGIDKADISAIQYRAIRDGKSGFLIQGAGREWFVSKHGYTILNLFYSRERCWKCYDLTAEFSDISLGDAWEMGCGWSRVIIRSPKAKEIVDRMIADGRMVSLRSGEEEIYATQRQLINYKKRTIGNRKKRLKAFPEYGVTMPEKKGLGSVKAELMTFLLKTGQKPFARKMLGLLPFRVVEKLSEAMRTGTLKEFVVYGFWGVVTVLFNLFTYWLFLRLGMDYRAANILSTVLTKTEAYLTNKFFVFRSRCQTRRQLLREIAMFIMTRGLTAVIDYFGLIILVEGLKMNKMAGKAVLIVVETLLNFIFGKKIVYRKKAGQEDV